MWRFDVKINWGGHNDMVAMRQCHSSGCADTMYLHGDHLGSVSLVTDDDGSVVSQARYTPYGELRWPGVSQMPTDFGYTGQRADSFGLMDYNARFYSPHLGRFVSADTVVPNPGNPKSYDRYLYVLANPLRFIDPSGHRTCEDMPWECENGEWRDTGPTIYNSIFIFTGGPGISHANAPSTQSWTSAERSTAVAEGMIAAEGYAQEINAYISALNAKMPQFGESPIPYVTPTEAFLMVHNGRPVELVRSSENRSYSGECFGANTIVFYNVSYTWTDTGSGVTYNIVDSDYIVDHPHVVLHELGHAFNNVIGGKGASGVLAGLMRPMVNGVIDPGNADNGYYGYAGPFDVFQFGYTSALPSSEEFADMYVGWALNRWNLDVQLGIDRQNHMNTVMPGYIVSGWLR